MISVHQNKASKLIIVSQEGEGHYTPPLHCN